LNSLCFRQLKDILPKKAGIDLVDRLLKVKFGEKNIKIVVLLDPNFPDYLFAFLSVPDILNIYALSTELQVQSPLPKLTLISKSTGLFGWAGSTGFLHNSGIIQ
jgi:hypothetical protein